MSQRMRRILKSLGFYALWAGLAALLVLTAYQIKSFSLARMPMVTQEKRGPFLGWLWRNDGFVLTADTPHAVHTKIATPTS